MTSTSQTVEPRPVAAEQTINLPAPTNDAFSLIGRSGLFMGEPTAGDSSESNRSTREVAPSVIWR